MSNLTPEGWQHNKLSEISKLITKGATPSTYGYDYTVSLLDNGAKFIRGNNATTTGKFDSRDIKYICGGAHEKLKRSQLKVGDVIVSIVGSVGTSLTVDEQVVPANINQNVALIRPSRELQSGYLSQVIASSIIQDAISLEATTQAQPSLSLKQVGDFTIPLPPLPEQKKIAAILTSVDDVIEKTQAQIDKLKDLKTAMMQELLTRGVGVDGKPHTEFKDSPVGRIPKEWDVVTTGSIAKSIVPGRNKPKQMNGNIPWLTIADLGDVYVDKSKSRRGVTREVLSEAKGKTLPKNTVIMSVVGEFGLSSIAARELVINQQLHGFVCGNKVDPTFLCLSLRYHKDQMEKLATQTTIAYMNKDNAESVVLALPSLSEQRKIASVIISIEEKVKSVNKTLHAKTLVKKALMQDLLIGRVRVKVED